MSRGKQGENLAFYIKYFVLDFYFTGKKQIILLEFFTILFFAELRRLMFAEIHSNKNT